MRQIWVWTVCYCTNFQKYIYIHTFWYDTPVIYTNILILRWHNILSNPEHHGPWSLLKIPSLPLPLPLSLKKKKKVFFNFSAVKNVFAILSTFLHIWNFSKYEWMKWIAPKSSPDLFYIAFSFTFSTCLRNFSLSEQTKELKSGRKYKIQVQKFSNIKVCLLYF